MSLTLTPFRRNSQVVRPTRWSRPNAEHWKPIQAIATDYVRFRTNKSETHGRDQSKEYGNWVDLVSCRGV